MSLKDEQELLNNLKEAKRNWEEKLAHYEVERSTTASPALIFELKKRIQECQKEIQRLSSEIEKLSEAMIRIQNTSQVMEEKVLSPQISPRRILILSANPKGTSQLRLDEERREIKEGLRRSRNRDQFEIETEGAVRYRDIHRAILDFEPNIVHFSGHGAGKDGLLFEDEMGRAKLVDAEALAGLFELFADRVECVVLNACYSKVQAKAIAQHISHVIGMSQAIQDRAAIEFVVGFYDGLGSGKSYDFAYKLGCNLIRTAGISENLTPQLLGKNYPDTPPHIDKPSSTSTRIDTGIRVSSRGNTSSSVSIEKTVDYTRLRDFLAAGELKEADRQTARILLELADREQEGWLCSQDIEKLPCSVLGEIDRLWFQHSNRLFGFGVQRQIWVDIGGLPDRFDFKVYSKFSNRVGWRRNNDWLKKYDDFTFTLAAPKGHLPSLRFSGVENGTNCWKTWKESFEYFLSRTETCLYQ
ncbi:MAG: GUN4 domain-containing protein [Nostoc sp.]|uniref:GUN4 domain-containing protein n=1 Tax=Nostoc sp. TaxID=1180 RepID=UPI002FF7540C